MSPQPTDFYKELLIEFQCWNDCTSNWDHPPLVVIEEMIQDYNVIATLYNKAAKSASLEEAQIDECYKNISKVYDEIVATQKRRAINRPWEELQPVPARLHGEPPLQLQVPALDPGQDAEVAADAPPASVLPSAEEEISGSTDEETRLLPDPEPGENSSPLPPEMTLPPVAQNAAGVMAPKYFVSGAASKPPETLLLMQFNATYNVANDDPHGTQGEPVLAAQVTYWVLTDTEELPGACTWVFPAIGIGVLQFAATATDKAIQEVKTGLNHYLLTKTFPKGIRGDYESAEQEQMFINTVGDQHNAESALREADLYYSKVTQFKAKKFAEFFGNRKKKKKKLNLTEILRKSRIPMIIQMKRKLTMKVMKRMNRKIMLMKRTRFYSETFSSLSFQTWPWQCHIIIPTACLRMFSGIKYEDEN